MDLGLLDFQGIVREFRSVWRVVTLNAVYSSLLYITGGFHHVVILQEVAGLLGDANYWKQEAEFQAYRKLFWDTVSLLLMCLYTSAQHCPFGRERC